MKYFKEELWKGINGISDVYDMETADEIFSRNIKKYDEYFHTEIARFLTDETLELYEKYEGFHDMKIMRLQYEQNEFHICGKNVCITFTGIKAMHADFSNCVDELGYIEILYREETNDFQVGILFSWEDSIYITCSNIVAF